MSVLQVEFFSSCLRRGVSFKAIIPIEKLEADVIKRRDIKTLYLLHGYTGQCSDWIYDSSILELANMHNIAVIMPSGDNSFYVDNPELASYYGEFIGKEIVEFSRAMFPLSEKREDTMIGGLSMGGFGAIRNGLKYSDVFGTIIALSSALITDRIADKACDFTKTPEPKGYYIKTFGDLDKLPGSDNDPKALSRKILNDKKLFPNIYIACGTEDFLLEENRRFKVYLENLGVGFTYIEEPGEHNMKFWNPQIGKALNWFESFHTTKNE